jgi:molecular chaperone GrpE
MTAPEEPGMGPIIRDNRRIDPVTGQPKRGKHAASQPTGTTGAGRPGAGNAPRRDMGGEDGSTPMNKVSPTETAAPAAAPPTPPVEPPPAVSQLQRQLAERTADLQRLQAEYANYRKRVDRDRAAVREQAVTSTLAGLLPALDAIDQAREHGELSGGFKSVADSLQSALTRLGLATYGEKGDAFDPKIHEALTSSYSPDVAVDTCVEILQPGYKVGERILRPARVAVAEPATGPDGSSNEPEWTEEDN